MTSSEKVAMITKFAEDMKAEKVEVLDVQTKTSVADYFVVCTGNSDRHVNSIAERVAEQMKALKERPIRAEGDNSGWVLQDYGDVVFHVMREEQRQFYDLETLWKTMQRNPDLEA
jgi:ribosome-associated protein